MRCKWEMGGEPKAIQPESNSIQVVSTHLLSGQYVREQILILSCSVP